MDYSRIRDFIISYTNDDEGLLADICREAISSDVPIIRREARDFLKTLLCMVKPKRILEIGTAVGYSTLVMASVMEGSDYHIDTIELDEDRIKRAEQNINMMKMEHHITQHKGDAVKVLEEMVSQKVPDYDFIFIDAAKAQYSAYLELCLKLAHSGTTILTDNILADGDVLESHFLVEKRDRTIHDRMRQYLYDITHDERLETSILSVADGMALSVVK